jgi:hypothetical protein
MDCTDAFGDSGCKIKIQGPGNCAGTVFVPCNDVMQFHYDANGQETFSIVSGNGATDDGGTGGGAQVASTSSLGQGVQQDVTSGSGSGLRGAKGSRRMT